MKTNVFVKTKNVKGFVVLMSELENLPLKIPKIALVTGDFGLGKSETIKWWSFKNDCIYVRANQGMSSRWLLSEIADELGEEYYWNSQATFNSIENHLLQEPKTIIIDEIDYLIEKNTVETLRDIHDRTGCPMVLVGMANADRKLAKYPHLVDRIYKTFKFEKYTTEDIKLILQDLTDIEITEDGLNYLTTRADQFRQIVKLINKIEKKALINQIEVLDEITLKELLNENFIDEYFEKTADKKFNFSECQELAEMIKGMKKSNEEFKDGIIKEAEKIIEEHFGKQKA